MPAYSCELFFTPGKHSLRLREMKGHDELLIDDTGSLAIHTFINNLIIAPADLKAEHITIPDRDYLLAGIYQHHYGTKMQSVVICPRCANPFDLDFSLTEFVDYRLQQMQPAEVDDYGYYHSATSRFRLPIGEDEIPIQGLSADEAELQLLAKCVADSLQENAPETIQEEMEKVAPMLMTAMQATCPECEHAHEVHFDIQSFLLEKIKNEQKRVTAEVHCIANAYHWSHKEILDLPRTLRKAYAALIGLE